MARPRGAATPGAAGAFYCTLSGNDYSSVHKPMNFSQYYDRAQLTLAVTFRLIKIITSRSFPFLSPFSPNS